MRYVVTLLLSLILGSASAWAQVSGNSGVSGFKLPTPIPNNCLVGNAQGNQWVASVNCSGTGQPLSVTSASPNVEINPSPGVGNFTIRTFELLNVERIGDYNVTVNDDTYTIMTGPHTYSIPKAGTNGIFSGWSVCFLNDGASGNSTINAAGGSVFKGASNTSTMTLTPGAWACLTVDNADYNVRTSLALDAGNFVPGTTKDNLALTRDLKKDFGAVCNGVTDDSAAFIAAGAWIATAPTNRLVSLPAATCATSTTVTLGNGREQNTTLSGGALLNAAALSVTSCTGIASGDAVAVLLDSGSFYTGTANGACNAGSVPITPVLTGPAAANKPVWTGLPSTYNGGGFTGYGSCTTDATAGGTPVSSIKYIGSAMPTTTLTVTANATDQILTVASTAGMTPMGAIGIVQDSGAVWWTSVNYVVSATSVAITGEVQSTATNGNVIKIANNPVVRIQGGIQSPVFEGVCLDANNLAGIGMEVVHAIGGSFRGHKGVFATKYTGLGHYHHPMRFLFGQVKGMADNQFEMYANGPQNNRTMGAWISGSPGPQGASSVAYSRNHYYGGLLIMGGGDATAAGLRVEHADNNTFYKLYTNVNGANTSGAGLYRQPTVARPGFNLDNVHTAPAYIGGVTDGTASGGSLGIDAFSGYATSDSEPIPTGQEAGTTASGGKIFGMREISTIAASNSLGYFLKDLSANQLFSATRQTGGVGFTSNGGFGFGTGAAPVTAGSFKIWIDNNGLLGLNTESPSERLDVQGNINLKAAGDNQGLYGRDASNVLIYSLTRQGSSLDINAASFGLVAGSTLGGTRRFFMDGSGNIGIGTTLTVGSTTALTLAAGELGITKRTASGTAPGASGAKISVVCGTNAGSAKIIAYAGTSTTPVTIIDNIGAAVTGC